MFLFLDVISPIPEFFVIEDNKLIFSKKILEKPQDKLSDNIFYAYQKIDKEINLSENIKKTAVTIGPGSYTSLRVGIAFISALSLSKDISYYPFRIDDIIATKKLKNINNIAYFIESSNNQKFLCMFNSFKELIYIKIEKEEFPIPEKINLIYYNFNKFLIKKTFIEQIKFSLIDEFLLSYNNFDLNSKKNIDPIYISNNDILN